MWTPRDVYTYTRAHQKAKLFMEDERLIQDSWPRVTWTFSKIVQNGWTASLSMLVSSCLKRGSQACMAYMMSLSRTPSFPSQDGPFVKILNCHWVCASNLKCKASSIKVYDSNRSGMCHFQQKTQLCTRSQAKAIYILFPDVQWQTDNSSCGLYALAYAYIQDSRERPYKGRLQWVESEIILPRVWVAM